MTELSGLSITVAGAGVLGLACSLRLAQAGARVTLCDPARAADNASGVAAGMLAPAFESVLDAEGGERVDLLLAAREGWPRLLEAMEAGGTVLDRSGALLAGRVEDADLRDRAAGRFAALGLAVEPLSGAELRARQPAAATDLDWGLYSPDDWRLEPAVAMAALGRAFERAGGRTVRASLRRDGGTWRLEGAPVGDRLLLATGAAAEEFAAWAPELAALHPVKGQIVHYAGGPSAGPVLRDRHGYVAPQPGGAIAGATMERGRRDREVDPDTLATLKARAARLAPALAQIPAEGRAGVRGATPDGLPLVGASAADPRLLLAVGARRNGWLLAPLVAEMAVALAAGETDVPFAEVLDPRRFG
jgi:glycine oxidase